MKMVWTEFNDLKKEKTTNSQGLFPSKQVIKSQHKRNLDFIRRLSIGKSNAYQIYDWNNITLNWKELYKIILL